MKFPITTMAVTLISLVSGIAQAEIYESKDAQGNPVFTDAPTAGAEKVELPTQNIADSVDVPPEAPATPSMGTSATESESGGTVVVVPDSYNRELEREVEADRPHEVLEAEKRYEVGDRPTAEELHRREEARKGEYIDSEGNAVRVEHRGHAGGRR